MKLFSSSTPPDFEGLDLLFSCVSSPIAKELLPQAVQKGVVCIDASAAFRRQKDVPLVIPEINPESLEMHQGIIASPNCTTTIMLLPLFSLHKRYRIKRIVAATYQAVSGAGAKGIKELEMQTRAHLDGREEAPSLFPTRCAFNVFPHEGCGEEEEKMQSETIKILEDPTIGVSAKCCRVPVFRVHSEALNVEFHSPFSLEEVENILSVSPGINFKENASAIDAAFQNNVLYGKVRIDPTEANTLEMWVVGDQLLKGSALNMIQIAELLCLK